MATPVGLQQILRTQGIQWGDSGRSGAGDFHLWFGGDGSLNTDATWVTSGYTLQVAPLNWQENVQGNTHGWNGTSALIRGAETQQGSSVYNVLTVQGRTADYAGTVATEENRFYTDTSAFNYTGKIRAQMNQVFIQTATGSTVTRPEPATGIVVISAGSDGTLTSGYGTAGELFHQSDTYVVTAFWSVFGTTQLQANGSCTTGYGGYMQSVTDALSTGTATGTFTTAFGSYGEVLHQANATITNANGHYGLTSNRGVGTITTARGVYGEVTNTSSGPITSAFGLVANMSNTGTGTVTSWQGVTVNAPVVSAAHPITTARGGRISNQGATGVTSAIGFMIDLQSGASAQNINLVLGAQPGGGSWNIYSTSTAMNWFGGAIVQGHTTAAINSTGTATAAQVATGYITSTSAAPTTITLPTGTALGTVLFAAQGTIHDLYIDNTAGASTVTIAVAVNGILSADAAANATDVGLLTIPSGVTGQACFRLMFSSATAYTFSRIA